MTLLTHCRRSKIDPKEGQPFELDELLEGTGYATIVRSPCMTRYTMQKESTPSSNPTPTPRIILSSKLAVANDVIDDSCGDTDHDDITESSHDNKLTAKDPTLYIKKFKDLEGDYRYKCKLCSSIYNSYGDVKIHIDKVHKNN